MDADGRVMCEVNGRWTQELSVKDCRTGQEEVIFKVHPKPENTERQYGWGYFTINLNYIDDEMRKTLPPTDCRRRGDQRLMEEGKYE